MVLAVCPASPAVAVDGVTEVCRFADGRFTEISGMTYSQRHPGVIYLHNDSSGGPLIFAVDSESCETVATLTVEGIEARDIEAIGSGRDRRGRPVLWVADIGDNVDSWPEVRVHRVREPPVLRDRTLTARTYRVTYPDRPHNAEALLADPSSSQLWLVTKQAARGTLYALPERLSRRSVNIAEPVGRAGAMVTDASVSPDGTRYAVRDYVDAEVLDGLPPGTDPQTVYLPLQLQGEAMTWTPDGSALLVAGERDDRLLRVELPAGSAPSPSASPGASRATSTPASPGSAALPGSGSADGQPSSGGEGGQLPVVLLAGALVGLAALVIASAEWRRRRPPAARRG
jgi:hypothetical protein